MFIPLLSLLPAAFFSAASSMGRIPHMDKIVHALLYGVQAVLLILAWRARTGLADRSLFVRVVLACSAYGFLMEALQRTLTDCRVFSWGDVAANAAGALVAACAIAWLLGRRPHFLANA